MNKIITRKKIFSNAKLNLYLEIIGQKENGYHLLETLMVPISLYDEIDITLFNKGNIEVITVNFDIPSKENIVYGVVEKIKKVYKLDFGIKVLIKKNIPTGAGLGGGSGNAASVINFLNEVFNFATKEELIRFASSIGADIPFFIINKPAFCEGIGEIITTVKVPEKKFYLFVPDYHVSTAEIFQKRKYFLEREKLFGSSIKSNKEDIYNYLSKNNLLYFNRLEESVKLIKPELFELTRKFPFKLHLTGSGACFYGEEKDLDLMEVEIINV